MKEIRDYLEMDIEKLHREVISDILIDPVEGQASIEILINTERYEEDHEFRLVIDTARAILLHMFGNFDSVIEFCGDMIERATSYQMWKQLSLALNSMANSFFGLNIYERAIEYYLMVIENEKRHNLIEMTSVAYNNLGLIYSKIKDHDKSLKCIHLGMEALERGGRDQPRYQSKKIQYSLNLVLEYCRSNKIEKAKELLKQIDKMRIEGAFVDDYAYYFVKMHYALYDANYKKAHLHYLNAKRLLSEHGIQRRLALLVSYVINCEDIGLEYDFFIDDVLEISKEDISSAVNAYFLYDILCRYYKEIGKKEEYYYYMEKFAETLKKQMKSSEEQLTVSLDVVEKLVQKSFTVDNISTQNVELERMAKKAIEHKNELQKAYQQIEMINEFGRTITSTTDLEQVVALIHKNLKENIPLDFFVIMIPDQNEQVLRTVINYAFDTVAGEETIRLEQEESLFVYCYRTGKTIFSTDKKFQEKFSIQKKGEKIDSIPSVIFWPLKVKESIVGVCSVQYAVPQAYSEYHLKFLEDLTPYLAIAVNNALRSKELEKEISSHLETQKKLEILNESLKRMSSIDGLTQINRRRVYDERIMELLQEAKEKRCPITVMMIDIDNFKSYNDTYGHLEGDNVLKKVAWIFRKNLDACSGVSARFGGEEFIGAFVGLSAAESLTLAEKIRSEIEEEKMEHRNSLMGVVTVSVGVVIAYRANVGMKSTLMRIADESLYMAKNSGKNKVVLAESNKWREEE